MYTVKGKTWWAGTGRLTHTQYTLHMTVCDGKDVYLLNTRFGLITLPSPAINKFLDKSLIYKTYDESVSKNDIDVKIVLAIWHNKQNNQAQPWWRHVWISTFYLFIFMDLKNDLRNLKQNLLTSL